MRKWLRLTGAACAWSDKLPFLGVANVIVGSGKTDKGAVAAGGGMVGLDRKAGTVGGVTGLLSG
jgi:hypothetical protein